MPKYRTRIILPTIICLAVVLSIVMRGNLQERPGVDWSPDGQWILFSCSNFSLSNPKSHLYLIRPDGTQLQQITADDFIAVFPAWSPDGEWIAFKSGMSIFKMKPDATVIEKVIDPSAFESFPYEDIQGLTWSSENQLVFSTQSIEGGRIYRIQNDGSELQVILKRGEDIESVAWLTDSQQIAYTVPYLMGSSSGVYIVDLNGESNWAFADVRPVGPIDWSPALGELLLTEYSTRSQRQLYRLNVENEELIPVATSFSSGWPAWSPDHTGITFSGLGEDGESWLEIYRAPLDGGNPQRLTEMQACNAIESRWFDFDESNE